MRNVEKCEISRQCALNQEAKVAAGFTLKLRPVPMRTYGVPKASAQSLWWKQLLSLVVKMKETVNFGCFYPHFSCARNGSEKIAGDF